MMDFNERVIPDVSANFLYKEALARYEFAQKVLKCKKRQRILDLACGTGYGSAFLSKENTVIGIDKDPKAISYAKKHYGKHAKFIAVNVETDLALQGLTLQSYNAICAFEIIEHLTKPKTFLKNIVQLLKPNGIVILSTPNAESPVPENSTKSKYHVKEFTQKEFEDILKKYFTSVEIFGQTKNKKAQKAFEKFMESQSARQTFVDTDKLHIRKLIPKKFKEKIWKVVGSPFGRKEQDSLETKDFPITKNNSYAEYFIAVCKK